MAVISLLEFRIHPEKVEEADAIIHEVLNQTRSRPGSEGVEVIRDVDDATRFVAVEHWVDLAADDAYRAFRATPEGASRLGEVMIAESRVLSRFELTAL